MTADDALTAHNLRQTLTHAELIDVTVHLAERALDGEQVWWQPYAHEEDDPGTVMLNWRRLVGSVERLRLYANGFPATLADLDDVCKVVDEAAFRLVFGVPSLAACLDCLRGKPGEPPRGEIRTVMLGTSFCLAHHIDRAVAFHTVEVIKQAEAALL